MAQVTLGGNIVNTYGELPEVGTKAPHFEILKSDLSIGQLKDFEGKRVILNIFPSIDTNVCATSVRQFSERVKQLKNTVVLAISRDLPFAQKRFMDDNEITNVINLSDFRERTMGKDYGLEMLDGPFKNLLSRVVIVIDTDGTILYTERVGDISDQPDYDAAIKALD